MEFIKYFYNYRGVSLFMLYLSVLYLQDPEAYYVLGYTAITLSVCYILMFIVCLFIDIYKINKNISWNAGGYDDQGYLYTVSIVTMLTCFNDYYALGLLGFISYEAMQYITKKNENCASKAK